MTGSRSSLCVGTGMNRAMSVGSIARPFASLRRPSHLKIWFVGRLSAHRNREASCPSYRILSAPPTNRCQPTFQSLKRPTQKIDWPCPRLWGNFRFPACPTADRSVADSQKRVPIIGIGHSDGLPNSATPASDQRHFTVHNTHDACRYVSLSSNHPGV
jgi:hypothetical protein